MDVFLPWNLLFLGFFFFFWALWTTALWAHDRIEICHCKSCQGYKLWWQNFAIVVEFQVSFVEFPQQETKIKAEFIIERWFLPQTLTICRCRCSLNQGEKILSSHNFSQLSRTTKSKEISLHNETVLFVDDLTYTFHVSSDI